ncbi:hypothetical protein TIFTF001_031276 [Ficus carica]|uniref:Uncharacterized protein n=1 Tax=Ficus carica TaxID=3494 RepID=A0AA88DUR4_FICCA|nr:hypothetical protein TIFTF001_031276 [Ficus carica]
MLGPVSMTISGKPIVTGLDTGLLCLGTNGNRIGCRFTMIGFEYKLLSCRVWTINQEHRTICKHNSAYSMDWIGCPNHSMLNGLVHGLSWIGLTASNIPWLCATVSNLPAILDARLYVPGANPGWIEEDRDASLAFWGMEPCIFDGTQGAATLVVWLHDMEILFKLCDVGAYLQVMLASRCLVGEARAWCLGTWVLERRLHHRYWTRKMIVARETALSVTRTTLV